MTILFVFSNRPTVTTSIPIPPSSCQKQQPLSRSAASLDSPRLTPIMCHTVPLRMMHEKSRSKLGETVLLMSRWMKLSICLVLPTTALSSLRIKWRSHGGSVNLRLILAINHAAAELSSTPKQKVTDQVTELPRLQRRYPSRRFQ